MQVRIRPGVKNHTEAFARFHRVTCDKPFDDGGSDTGMTPEELLLSAVGCSAMQHAAAYLRSRGLSLDGFQLGVSAEPSDSGLGQIAMYVEAPGLTAHKREAVLKSIEASPLFRTLAKPNGVSLGFLSRVAENAAIGAGEAPPPLL